MLRWIGAKFVSRRPSENNATNVCHKDDIRLCLSSEAKTEETNLSKVLSKIITFLLVKVLVKHAITSRLKLVFCKSMSTAITVLTKTLTITVCKAIFRRALYPVMRTSVKTLMILSLKALMKPVFAPMITALKDGLLGAQLIQSVVKKLVTLVVKVSIKTTVIQLIVQFFHSPYNGQDLNAIYFRVCIILSLKMVVKECINYFTKSDKIPKEMKKNIKINANRKLMIYTVRKVTTKLLKWPLINLMLWRRASTAQHLSHRCGRGIDGRTQCHTMSL